MAELHAGLGKAALIRPARLYRARTAPPVLDHQGQARPGLPGLSGWLHGPAERADLHHDHVVGALVWLAAGLVVTGLCRIVIGIEVAAAVLVVILAVPPGLLVAWSGRRNDRVVRGLPVVVDLVARSLRSGASLSQALTEAAAVAPQPVAGELDSVLHEIRRGRTTHAALQAWADRSTLAEVRLVAAALAIASDHQAGATRSLESVGHALRDRSAIVEEIAALTAQASASMQALVLLPMAFLGLDLLTSRHVVDYLATTPLGRVCLAAGLVLDAIGWLWMRLVIRRRLPR